MLAIQNTLPRVLVLTLAALTATVSLGACASTGGPNRARELTQVRELAHFSKIEAVGPVELKIEVGAPLGVSVRATESQLAELVTEVVAGTLRVQLPNGGGQGAALQVGLPHLGSLSCSGGASSKLSGLRGGQLSISLGGNGKVWAEGTLDSLTGRIDGPGTLDLDQLEVRLADIQVRGSGKAEVTVSGALDAVVQGGGDVLYHGDPIVTADTSGSGNVSPRR